MERDSTTLSDASPRRFRGPRAIVERADVRVIEARDRARLPLEAGTLAARRVDAAAALT